MKKRLTDTEIWDKPWFRKLSLADKLAFIFIKDKCDNVGVWIPDMEIANIYIGTEVDWKKLPDRCNGNIQILDNGKWWIPDFTDFQWGYLDEEKEEERNNKARKSYIRLLKKHGLWNEYLKQYERSTRGLEGVSKTPNNKNKNNNKIKNKNKKNAQARAGNDNKIPQKAQELLEYYIKLTGKTRIKTIPKEVTARLRDGASIEDGTKVILYKYLCWWNDEKTRPWVNLTTLFRPSHFEEYLSQAEQELEQMLLKAYKCFQKKFFDANMAKPLEERKKLKVPTLDEFKKDYSFTESRMNSPPG